MKTFKNIFLVLSTGYIFVFFSEHIFWARIRPEDTLQNWINTWVGYSLMAFVFLHLVVHFKIATRWPLFLAGAAFGWMAEGIVVQTTYEMLPLSISFTGLAWHALITIWIGWYALRQRLSNLSLIPTVKLAVAIGAGFGLWAISWWSEPDGGITALKEFSTYVLVTSILVMVAYWLANWCSSEPFVPNRWVTGPVYGLFLFYFLFVTVPAAPVAILILPPLFGLIYYALRKNKRFEQNESLLVKLNERGDPLNYLSLLVMPLTAIAVYAAALILNLQWQTNWVLYLITTPLGVILFVTSLVKTLRTP